MAKALDFNMLLTKLSNVFKHDMYIYNNKYCIGGTESENENEGQILCVLNQEASDLLKSIYKSDYISFSDIKKAKKEPEVYMSIVKDSITQKLIKTQYESLQNEIDKKENKCKWNTLELSESDIEDIFVNRNLHAFFENDDKVPTVELVKSTFPLLSEKNVGDTEIMYKSFGKDENDIASLVIGYPTELFYVYNYIMYFSM